MYTQLSIPGPKPKGVTVGKNIGGYLNVRLGKEGAPIYMDQSPSYIYKDPPIERNQNGVSLPRPAPSIVKGKYKFEDELQANFIRPANDAMIYQKNRKLGTHQSFNTDTLGAKDVHKNQNSPYLELPVEKEEVNDHYQNLGEQEYTKFTQNKDVIEKFADLIGDVNLKLKGLQRMLDNREMVVENLIENLYSQKFIKQFFLSNLIKELIISYEKQNSIMSNKNNGQKSLSFNLNSQINGESINYVPIQENYEQAFQVKQNLFGDKKIQKQKSDSREQKRYRRGDNLRDYANEQRIEKKQKEYYRGLNRYEYLYRDQNQQIINIYPDVLNQHICPICLNKFKEKQVNHRSEYENTIKFTRECGHNFCEICIDQIEKSCPICKTKIDSSKSVQNRVFANTYFEEKDFLCQNCNFPFDSCLRKPILLTNCGHTFCLYCVEMKQNKKKVLCIIDETETDINKGNLFENRLFKEDIEKKKNEDIKRIKDTDSSNIYYCMNHYVPIKQDHNLYHNGQGHTIINNDDVDLFISEFQKQYDIQKQQIYASFDQLGDLEFNDLYDEYDDLKRLMIDSKVEFKYLDEYLRTIDIQQHLGDKNLQQHIKFLDQLYSSKFQKQQMNKFWNHTKEISFLKKQTNQIFENLKKEIDQCDTRPEKIYSLPNFFILFFKLEKIRQNLCKKYQYLFGSFMYNSPAIDGLLTLFDDSKKKMNQVYNKLDLIRNNIDQAMKKVKKIIKEHDDFVCRVKKQKIKFESTKFVQNIKTNFHSYFYNPKFKNEDRQINVGFDYKNIIEKTLNKNKNIQELELNLNNQSTIEQQKDNRIEIDNYKDQSFIKEQEQVIDKQWKKLDDLLEKFGTDNLFNLFKDNNKVLKFLRFR